MRKSFIFDLDGVIIDSEPAWDREKAQIFATLFGEITPKKIGQPRGLSMGAIYEHAVLQLGLKNRPHEQKLFLEMFHRSGDKVYQEAALTHDLEHLVEVLQQGGYAIGVVSAAPAKWIQMALDRSSLRNRVDVVISLEDRGDLRHKPAPDGYREAITRIHGRPEATVVLEDSNTGVASAKAAQAYTIALTCNLTPGYVQTGADEYVDTLLDVVDALDRRRELLAG
jgi:mannitol-1-/sugar-/sorbitol-6-/2-deoxyglucose-6-phosphatase